LDVSGREEVHLPPPEPHAVVAHFVGHPARQRRGSLDQQEVAVGVGDIGREAVRGECRVASGMKEEPGHEPLVLHVLPHPHTPSEVCLCVEGSASQTIKSKLFTRRHIQ
jgi:hypothetical protein